MEHELCRKHGNPLIWGRKKRGQNKYNKYCTACLDEEWEKIMQPEREEREKWAHLILYERWLMVRYSSWEVVKRSMQHVKLFEKRTGKCIDDITPDDINHLDIANNTARNYKKFYNRYQRFKGR